MTLKITDGTNGKRYFVLTKCPACGFKFRGGVSREHHFRTEHVPSDFGLSPLRSKQ